MAALVSTLGLGFRHSVQDPWLFRNLNLTLRRGDILTVVGRSGCGKSTLLRILGGLIPPTEGCVQHRSSAAPNHLAGAMLFQDARLLPWRRASANVALGCETLSLSRSIRQARIQRALEAVGLSNLAQRYPHQLSGGQQHRISLARALASDAPLLLLDEPFAALDPQTHSEMVTMLRTIAEEEGRAVVLVTHHLSDATAFAGEILDLEQQQRVSVESGLLLALS